MRKLYIFGLIALACVIVGLALADQMTLSTYYPAPAGVYKDMAVMNRLGVGTTSPDSSLHVDQPNPTGSDALIAIVGPGWNAGNSYNAGNRRLGIFAWEGSAGLSLGENNIGGYLIENSGQNLTFKTGYDGSGGEKMRIDTAGNVGIGTTTPVAKLDVKGITITDRFVIRKRAANPPDIQEGEIWLIQ